MNGDGSSKTEIPGGFKNSSVYYESYWAPDSSKMIYVPYGWPDSTSGIIVDDIYLIDMASNIQTKFADYAGVSIERIYFKWSPDSTKLYYM